MLSSLHHPHKDSAALSAAVNMKTQCVSALRTRLRGMTGDDPGVVGYGLVRLAEVLRAIGDEVTS